MMMLTEGRVRSGQYNLYTILEWRLLGKGP